MNIKNTIGDVSTPRYKLFTLFILITLFTLFKLLFTAYTVACMPIYIISEG